MGDSTLLDNEISRIFSHTGDLIVLDDGTKVYVPPITVRGVLTLIDIISRGARDSMAEVAVTLSKGEPEEIIRTIVSLIMNGLIESDEEFYRLLRQSIVPVNPNDVGHLDTLFLEPEITDSVEVASILVSGAIEDIKRILGIKKKEDTEETPKQRPEAEPESDPTMPEVKVGLVAAVFDKIQVSYGWTDEYILDLPFRRAVQIKEAIEQRLSFDKWERHKVIEWEVRSITGFIANTVEDSGARETLSKASRDLTLFDAKADTGTGPQKNRQKTFKLKDGRTIPASELKNYTYEEIDHTEEDRKRKAAARAKNSGKSITKMFHAR